MKKSVLRWLLVLVSLAPAAFILSDFEPFERLHVLSQEHKTMYLGELFCLLGLLGLLFPVLLIARNRQVRRHLLARQEAEQHARFMTRHDPLTGLLHRRVTSEVLRCLIDDARARGGTLSVLLLDLDRFKPINDQFGHGVGDIVLMQVAERLRHSLRTSDSVCRLGGDEFVILLESTDTIDGATLVAQKAIDSLNEPIEAGDHVCFIGASIGISVYPVDCEDAETMLRHADIAMYEAKKKGRNCWHLHDAGAGTGPGRSSG